MLLVTYLIENVDRETWNRFKAACALRGRKINEVLPDLIRRVGTGEIAIDEAAEKPPTKKVRT